MTYTSLSSKSTGDTITASDWALIDSDLDDLDARVTANTFSGCTIERTTTQSIPDSTLTPLNLTAEIIDEGSWFPGSGTTVTVPAGAIPSGYTKLMIHIQVSLEWEGNTTGRRTLNIFKNGSLIGPNFQQAVGSSLSFAQINNRTYWFESGDTIQVQAYQDSGGSLDVNSALVTVARIGYFN